MNNMILVSSEDTRPLPLIVAEKWNFKLDYVHKNGVFWFAIPDWIAGILSTDARGPTQVWADMRRRGFVVMSVTRQQLPCVARDGKKSYSGFY